LPVWFACLSWKNDSDLLGKPGAANYDSRKTPVIIVVTGNTVPFSSRAERNGNNSFVEAGLAHDSFVWLIEASATSGNCDRGFPPVV